MSFFLLAVVFVLSCSQNQEQPGYEIPILTDMKKSVAYETNTVELQNVLKNRNPIEGTIHRDQQLIESSLSAYRQNESSLANGQYLYEIYCQLCHGKTGEGDGPLIPKFPNPPDLSSTRVQNLSDLDVFNVISNGKGNMPAHASQLDPIERLDVIHHVKKLQGKMIKP